MSRVTESVEFRVPPDELLETVRRAAARMKYKLGQQSAMTGVLNQGFFAAQAEGPVPGGARADIVVTNFGFGPVQTGHCQKQLRRLREALDQEIAARPPPPPSQVDEIYCSRCGQVVKKESQYCSHCGAAISQ
ncbi:MAG: zinc ribbon domain-containing protein [Nitrospiraceae bacterium]